MKQMNDKSSIVSFIFFYILYNISIIYLSGGLVL